MPNDIPEFATMPVGPVVVPPPGMFTKFVPKGRSADVTVVLPLTEKTLDVPVTWLEIQTGVPPSTAVRPHVFVRFGSVILARLEMSEASSVCLNCACAARRRRASEGDGGQYKSLK